MDKGLFEIGFDISLTILRMSTRISYYYFCIKMHIYMCNRDCAYKRNSCFKIGRTRSVLRMFEVKNR